MIDAPGDVLVYRHVQQVAKVVAVRIRCDPLTDKAGHGLLPRFVEFFHGTGLREWQRNELSWCLEVPQQGRNVWYKFVSA
jgi:hypothetical protein